MHQPPGARHLGQGVDPNSARSRPRILQRLVGPMCLLYAAVTWAAPDIRVEMAADGTLSVAAQDADVMEVLNSIAALADIRVLVSGTAPRVTGSWSFAGVPLETGIERILDHIDHIVVRRPVDQAPNAVASIWILTTRGASLGAVPARHSAPAPAALAVPDPVAAAVTPENMDALLGVIAEIETSGDPDAVQRLDALLSARDPLARSAVTAALARSGDARAQQSLAQLLYGDPDPAVRHDAADALAGSGQEHAVALLRRALEDPDPGVRAHVEQLLEGLNVKDPQ